MWIFVPACSRLNAVVCSPRLANLPHIICSHLISFSWLHISDNDVSSGTWFRSSLSKSSLTEVPVLRWISFLKAFLRTSVAIPILWLLGTSRKDPCPPLPHYLKGNWEGTWVCNGGPYSQLAVSGVWLTALQVLKCCCWSCNRANS